jgi:integrase
MGMNEEFLARSRTVFLDSAPASLQQVRDRVMAQAAGTDRRDMLSALDTVSRLFKRDLANIRASAKSLRPLFGSASAAQLGISDKRYANVRSCVAAALRRYSDAPAALTKRIVLSAEWTALLARVDRNTYRFALYRLACFCSQMKVDPDRVDREVLLGFFAALQAEEIVKHPKRILKHTMAHWNMCAKIVPNWPVARLSSPFDQDLVALPLQLFPESFRADLARWQRRLLGADVLDVDAPARPLRPITVRNNSAIVARFASAVVRCGQLTLPEVRDLAVLVQVDNFKAGLRVFLDRAGGDATPYVAKIATTLLYIGKHYCGAPPAALKEHTALCKRLQGKRVRQMSQRNRERLRQFDDSENVRKLLAFPAEERARGLAEPNTYRAAKYFERALAVALWTSCVLRIQNMRTIELTSDVRWAGGKCFLSIEASKTKNRQALEFELPQEDGALLKEFVELYRPRLPGAHGQFLFPGRGGKPRADSTMRCDFRDAMRRRVGLTMNPHLMRHTVAKIVVERDPGMYGAVSQLLGHKHMDMTSAHYLGTETRAAGRHVNRLLQDAKAEKR